MKIGIIGLGIIGKANKAGFEKEGHDISFHDTKLDTSIEDVLNTNIIFICVPTPSRPSGECDTSIVESIIRDLFSRKYNGVIAIRSTVVPGFTYSMKEKFNTLKICFVPEFIRERCAEFDFILEQRLLAVGTEDSFTFNTVVQAHGSLPRNVVQLKMHEAELLKYYSNLFAATRITFANAFYEVCKKFDADYQKIKDAYIKTGRVGDMYLEASEKMRGFGGMCLPKDTRAFIKLIENLDLDLDIFKAIHKDNSKFLTTIFEGMREENE